MTTVADLIATKTAAAYFDELVAGLTARGFPVTAWQSGGAGRTLTRVDADALADLRTVVTLICKGGFLDEAEGDWLTLLAYGVFLVTRVGAVFMEGNVTLAAGATVGPYTIQPAGLVVSDGTRRWRSTNASNVTVPSGGTAPIRVKAESPGDAYNVSGEDIDIIVSPASAGLSVSAAYTPTVVAWHVTSGSAEETDASLRARCRAKWGVLGRGANDAAYEHWARAGHGAEAQVTRAAVVWGPGDGTLTVYLAGPSGPVSSEVENIVGAWIESNQPGTDFPTIVSASARAVSLLATVTVRAASDSAANRALATDALAAYIAGLDIGEDVDLGRLYNAFFEASGLIDVDISQPATDTSVNNGEVATLSTNITWVPV